ncbi:threonine synthase [Actinospongicola halichondriae]|uniref:threonine synthase n=1 Tax=Actinospongicola halichondriae TaxID=3236844 RepID=UPI003D3BC0C6
MTLLYGSTRGDAPSLDFADTLLTGLAPDGGLYVPDAFPALPELDPSAPYAEVASAVMWPFVEGTIDRSVFDAIVAEAYATFDHVDVCPLVRLDDRRWLLELFHGPTIAFKDVALQLVGRLFDHFLTERDRRATILVATSGDTGSAAMHGCLGREALDCVVLFPEGRVSDVQRRQMTTLDAPNVHAVALDGTFDDCQDIVKAAFADRAFRDEVSLSAMNSINWGRVMAQVVYYVTARHALVRAGETTAPVFSVPTGNFGNVLAGWVAQQMGLDVGGFIVASNTNDILARWLETGTLSMEPVVPTLSPSMDIQVSSNLERLLHQLLGRDGDGTGELLREFRASGRVDAPRPEGWWSGRVDDEETLAVIAEHHAASGVLLDPHTAVGVGAVDRVPDLPDAPVVCLATAHPAKFPDAVEQATGIRPPLPKHLADLLELPERAGSVSGDLDAVEAVVRSLTGR